MSRPKIIKQLKLKNPNLSQSDLETIIDTICQNIELSLKKGEKIEVPEKKTIIFKSSKEWKKKLNEKK